MYFQRVWRLISLDIRFFKVLFMGIGRYLHRYKYEVVVKNQDGRKCFDPAFLSKLTLPELREIRISHDLNEYYFQRVKTHLESMTTLVKLARAFWDCNPWGDDRREDYHNLLATLTLAMPVPRKDWMFRQFLDELKFYDKSRAEFVGRLVNTARDSKKMDWLNFIHFSSHT